MGKKVKHPLSRSITAVCAVFIGLLCIAASLEAYTLYSFYTSSMLDRYEKQLDSVLDYVEAHIDHDDMAQCAETLVESEKYKEFQAFFDDLIDNYGDVHYLYIMGIDPNPDEPTPIYEVCAANSTYEKENEPENVLHLGDRDPEWYDAETTQKFREILEKGQPAYLVNDSEWGTDYTRARPIFDSSGKAYALLCADIGIDQLNDTVYFNIYLVVGVIIALSITLIALMVWWMHRNVTDPIKKLEASVSGFAESSAGSRDPSALTYTRPDIRVQNEVGSLADAIEKLSIDMKEYVKDAVAAENETLNLKKDILEMSAVAYQDGLTRVKNRAAYEVLMVKLDEKIGEGTAEFAIVMMDLNGLKDINDRFGHDKGDAYLIAACHYLCAVFNHSPVFRIGGDEFVAIAQNADYEKLDERMKQLEQDCIQHNTKVEHEWERVDVSIGVAVFDKEIDKVSGDTARRADQLMYEDKKRKKEGGVHR